MAEQEELQLEQPADPAPPEQAKVTINLDEVDDDADEKGGQAAATEDQRPPRRQQIRDLRRQKDAFERELAQLRTEFAEFRGRMSVPAPAQQGGQAAGSDPLDAEIASIEEQQQVLMQAIQAPGQAQENVQRLYQSWRKMETQRRRLETKQVLAAEKQTAGPGPEQDEDRYIKGALAAEFPGVWGNQVMMLRAQAEMQDLMNRGKPRGLETAREACRRVLGRSGQGQRPPGPSDLERSRHAGIPARAGVAGNGSGNQYQPNKFEMNLARAFTKHKPDLSDEERWRTWAKATGSMPKAG